MPRNIPGKHNLHVKLDKTHFRTLQSYCSGGVERISASAILDLFLTHYIEDYLVPRMARGESASWSALQVDLPHCTSLIANLIEPKEFASPPALAGTPTPAPSPKVSPNEPPNELSK